MAGIYASIAQSMLTGGFNWTTGSFGLMLVGPGYTPNYGSDTTLANIPSGAQLLASPLALSGEEVTNGFCGASGVSWASLTTTAKIQGIAILQNVAGTWNLVCYIDQGEGFGQTPNNVPVGIAWDTRGIFRP